MDDGSVTNVPAGRARRALNVTDKHLWAAPAQPSEPRAGGAALDGAGVVIVWGWDGLVR